MSQVDNLMSAEDYKALVGASKFSGIFAYGYSATFIAEFNQNRSSNSKLGSDFDDKLYHATAYIIMGFVWGVHLLHQSKRNYILLSFLIGALFGIIIELLQVTLTSTEVLIFSIS